MVAFSFWSKKNIKGKGNSELFNELLLAALFFIIVFLLPDVFKPTQTTPEQANVFFNVMFLALAIEGIIFAYMLINAYYKTQKDPVRKEKMNYAKYMEDFIENYVDNPKKDIQRKGLHVLPVVIIIAFYHISYHLSDVGVLYPDIDPLGFYYFLVLTVALAFVQMFMLEDLCRMWNRFEALPDWAYDWITHSMVPDELDTFLTSTPMVVALFPFLFTPIPLLFSVGIIASLSDAIASIVGKRLGKHKWPMNKKKSIEGTLAAVISVYAAVILCYTFYGEPVSSLRLFGAATAAAFVFTMVDLFAEKVSDNLLNSLLCGGAIYFVMYVL